MPKEFRIYRPNKNKNGVASAWQLSYKPDEKFEKWMVFLTMCSQVGEDANGNAKFNWTENITVKIGENDIGEFLSVFNGVKDHVKLFHQSPGGGNKSIDMTLNKEGNGFYLKVSRQDKEKNLKSLSHSVSFNECSILKVLLEQAIKLIYGWDAGGSLSGTNPRGSE